MNKYLYGETSTQFKVKVVLDKIVFFYYNEVPQDK